MSDRPYTFFITAQLHAGLRGRDQERGRWTPTDLWRSRVQSVVLRCSMLIDIGYSLHNRRSHSFRTVLLLHRACALYLKINMILRSFVPFASCAFTSPRAVQCQEKIILTIADKPHSIPATKSGEQILPPKVPRKRL